MNKIDLSQYNLNLADYSIQDIYRLFQLKPNEKLTKENLFEIKKKVLKNHPDKKSGKPVQLYLFYISAYKELLNFYNMQNKNDMRNIKTYNDVLENYYEKPQINTEKIYGKDFNNELNDFFNKNMKQKKSSHNNWFFNENDTNNDDDEQIEKRYMDKINNKNQQIATNYNPNDLSYYFEDNKININFAKNDIAKETNEILKNKMKELKKQQGALIEYKGYQEIIPKKTGANYLDDGEDEAENEYVTCDVFANLPFDDLRKVYRDQTIFSGVDEDKKINVETDIKKYEKLRKVKVNDAIYRKQEMIREREKRKKELEFKEKQMKDFEENKRKKEISDQFLAKYLQIKN